MFEWSATTNDVSTTVPGFNVSAPLAVDRAVDPDAVRAARARIRDDSTVDVISRQLHTLGGPARLRIAVALLAAGEPAVTDVTDAAGLTGPAASRHPRAPRAERLVTARRAGWIVLYSLADRHVRDCAEFALAHND